MKPEIRRARIEDAPAASQLAVRAKSAWGYPDTWMASWVDALTITADDLATCISYVAVLDGEIVGVCTVDVTRDAGSLDHLWVAPECQRHGVGRALAAQALAAAADAGASSVRVESDPFAEGFYLRLGARRLGSVPAPMPGALERTLPLLEFELRR